MGCHWSSTKQMFKRGLGGLNSWTQRFITPLHQCTILSPRKMELPFQIPNRTLLGEHAFSCELLHTGQLDQLPSVWWASTMHRRGRPTCQGLSEDGLWWKMLQMKRCQNTTQISAHRAFQPTRPLFTHQTHVFGKMLDFLKSLKTRRTLHLISRGNETEPHLPSQVQNTAQAHLGWWRSPACAGLSFWVFLFLESIHLTLHLRNFYITVPHMNKWILVFYYFLLFKYHWWIKAT